MDSHPVVLFHHSLLFAVMLAQHRSIVSSTIELLEVNIFNALRCISVQQIKLW